MCSSTLRWLTSRHRPPAQPEVEYSSTSVH
jgi:hypothetical protein